ncbi:MAG: nuclear transport factor 2 family protein [Anaerolineae bacterium]|nr:nuclear transport factor 2 family protein [Anaerolineae bacterium]
MNGKTSQTIALQFNSYFNSHDIDNLATLMTSDHVFIDVNNTTIEGKEKVLGMWQRFFENFQDDYRNIFEYLAVQNDVIIIQGHTVWTISELEDKSVNNGLWTMKIRDGKVAEWRVYVDTPENRKQLEIDG